MAITVSWLESPNLTVCRSPNGLLATGKGEERSDVNLDLPYEVALNVMNSAIPSTTA